MERWSDSAYLEQFLIDNKKDYDDPDRFEMANRIIEEGYDIEAKILDIIDHESVRLDHFFRPLNNSEYQFRTLSLRKGRIQILRLYAIRIEQNTYVVTGGAIKLPFHHLMEDRPHTREELGNIQRVKSFLEANDVFDNDSFYEFLKEQ